MSIPDQLRIAMLLTAVVVALACLAMAQESYPKSPSHRY